MGSMAPLRPPAMCTFGIDELRQQAAEILLRWRNAEEHALRAHVPVEGLHVGDSEPEFDLSRRLLQLLFRGLLRVYSRYGLHARRVA